MRLLSQQRYNALKTAKQAEKIILHSAAHRPQTTLYAALRDRNE